MVSCDEFAALDTHLRTALGVALPFGGLRVVLFCDVLQLQPVDGRYFWMTRPFVRLEQRIIVFELTTNHRIKDGDEEALVRAHHCVFGPDCCLTTVGTGIRIVSGAPAPPYTVRVAERVGTAAVFCGSPACPGPRASCHGNKQGRRRVQYNPACGAGRAGNHDPLQGRHEHRSQARLPCPGMSSYV